MAVMTIGSPAPSVNVRLKASADIFSQMTRENAVYIVSDNFDLGGDTLRVPASSELRFKGGMISNGTVEGNGTVISECSDAVFNKVSIKGSWNVPRISTAMFADLSADNSLRNVIALSDDSVANEITIAPGHYYVKAKSKNDISGLVLRSNTVLNIQGVIEMRPNGMSRSYVILIQDKENIVFNGGEVIGEKDSHKGEKGEWGMGIYIKNSKKIEVRGTYVHNCWGDCIVLGAGSDGLLVDGCRFENARRQGVTVGGCQNAVVSNCTISKIQGTAPEAGIDIEPDADHAARNITIDNVTIKDCIGGIFTYGNAENVVIDNILIKNCKIGPLLQPKTAMSFSKTTNLRMEGCTVNNPGALALRVVDCSGITITGNTIKAPNAARAVFCSKVKGLSVKGNNILGAVQGNYKSGEVTGNKKITK